MRTWVLPVLMLVLSGPRASGFVHSRTSNGQPLRRSDFAAVRYLINEQTAPGLTNSSGSVTITSDSDPISALQAAMDTWTNVETSNLTFAPPGRTSQETSVADRQHIISFADTRTNRSVLGDAVAVTLPFTISSTGEIVDADILFNPTLTYSTTLENGTFDIQSVATHELGHALGAGHSGLLSATMYYAVRTGNNTQSILTADDIAFLTDAYPEPAALSSFGSISGTITLNGGGAVQGALVTAIDPSTGIAVGSITGPSGTYTIAKVPPGRYFFYTEPMDGPVMPDQLGSAGTGANVDFSTTFLGGAEAPRSLSLGGGQNAVADITVESGTPALNVQGGGSTNVGGSARLFGGATVLRPGQTMDFAVFGKGLDSPAINETTVSFLGSPIAIQRGSLRRGRTSSTNLPIIIFTVQVPSSAPLGVATLLVRGASSAAVYSAGVKMLSPAPVFSAAGVVNAASFTGNAVAPGEIISIFGTGLGPATGVAGGLDGNGRLSAAVAGVNVTFNGVAAPLFYVSQGQINAQVPFEVTGQSNADIVVTYQSAASSAVRVPVAAARPGIFVVLNEDLTLNGPSNPARIAAVVFATGQGAIGPALGTGELAPLSPLSSATQLVTATVGGRPAPVLFAGMTPTFVGLLQVNIDLRGDLPSGPNVPITITVGGVSTQPNVTLAK